MTWKTIKDFPKYKVSNKGEIVRVSTGKILKPIIDETKGNYPYVKLYGERGFRRNCYIHVVVARAFLGEPPEGLELHHKDCDRMNFSDDNLEYCTHAENMRRLREELLRDLPTVPF